MKNENTRRGYTQMTDTLSLRERMGVAQVRGKENKANLICTPSSALRASFSSRGKWTTRRFIHKGHPEFISGSTPLVTIQNKEEMLKQVQHDNRRGFTLIELLVVVLIIGILAAIAVPQYQKAVAKARVVKHLTVFNAVSKSIDAWLLANGWPTEKKVRFTGNGTESGTIYSSLDVDFGTPSIFSTTNTVSKNLELEAKIFVGGPALIALQGYDQEKRIYLQEGPDACFPQFQRQIESDLWNFTGIHTQKAWATAEQCKEYQQIMCQYWSTQGTGLGRNPSIEQCARFGITLTKSGS